LCLPFALGPPTEIACDLDKTDLSGQMVRWSLYGFSTSSRWGGGGGIRLDPERILPSRAAFVSKAIAMHGAQFFLLTLRSCDIFLRQTCACEWVQMRTCRQP
ncbi:unnamed protein product, partial [Ectocarpus sp. 12 AP-2014]